MEHIDDNPRGGASISLMMEWAAALGELVAVRAVMGLLRSAGGRDGSPLIEIGPVIQAARAPLLGALVNRIGTEQLRARLVVVVVRDGEGAERIAHDLGVWLGGREIKVYPTSDGVPGEMVAADDGIRRQRFRTLESLAQMRHNSLGNGEQLAVLVAPITALLQPTLAPHEYEGAVLRLQAGAVISPEHLMGQCLRCGYRSVAQVESPGEMARRGGILDVWSPAEQTPVRIEWFGNEIEEMRWFDIETQRSISTASNIVLAPVHEYPSWEYERLLRQLPTLSWEGMRPEHREIWEHALAMLQAGTTEGGDLDLFAPLFRTQYQDGASGFAPEYSLLAHLPANSMIVLHDAAGLRHQTEQLARQAAEYHASLIGNGELPSGFPQDGINWESFMGQMNAAQAWAVLHMTSQDASDDDNYGVWIRGWWLGDSHSVRCAEFVPVTHMGGQLRRFVDEIRRSMRDGERVMICTEYGERLHALFEDEFPPELRRPLVSETNLESGGWKLDALRMILYTDREMMGTTQRRSATPRRYRGTSRTERAMFLRALAPGDYVVHIEHGIAVYDGLQRRTIDGIEREYLSLRYAAGDRLWVPIDQADRVTRYVGSGDGIPSITRLGTQEWERAKQRAQRGVYEMAHELLALSAQRETTPGYAFGADTPWQADLEGAFPYIETEDQLRSLEEVKRDMESPRPMDRLLCGDVGFGKTEIALRVSFKAIQDGKQVAMLVPTTVLAQQQYDVFCRRMADFPVRIAMLSRFRTPKEQEEILNGLARGSIDIVIGTHRLLSRDVRFRDLGLLIIDEEQRFGVRHKEQLKQLRAHIDVLTMTATPIPRTLHMSLAGMRDMSVLSTPPEERVPIKTYVVAAEDGLMRDAIGREIGRGGQVYVVHNRVRSIYRVAKHIQGLVPEARIGIAHGQLDERELERVMVDFFTGQYDVLVCTTIIENGLDVPNANTMVIDDAPSYGLAQLYQLRGRVGRSAARAYAYLLYHPERTMSDEAQQRLEAIQEATHLGAGFQVAMRDLEIRGAGNLLGAEQSGHIVAVGFDLYSRLLEQAVQQLQTHAMPTTDESSVHVAPSEEHVLVSPLVMLDLPLTAYLPENYIGDDSMRLSMYQRLADTQTLIDIETIESELYDRFGKLPQPALDLLLWLRIKVRALRAGVTSIVTTREEIRIRLPEACERGRMRVQQVCAREGRSGVRVGAQFVRLDRREVRESWAEILVRVLHLLGDGNLDEERCHGGQREEGGGGGGGLR